MFLQHSALHLLQALCLTSFQSSMLDAIPSSLIDSYVSLK
jgi:hypothetical protein